MTVAFCVWLFENYFRRVLVDGSLFISRCCSFFSAKESVRKKKRKANGCGNVLVVVCRYGIVKETRDKRTTQCPYYAT